MKIMRYIASVIKDQSPKIAPPVQGGYPQCFMELLVIYSQF